MESILVDNFFVKFLGFFFFSSVRNICRTNVDFLLLIFKVKDFSYCRKVLYICNKWSFGVKDGL